MVDFVPPFQVTSEVTPMKTTT